MKVSDIDQTSQQQQSNFFLAGLIAIASVIFILTSSYRWAVFRAGTDLGFFDQLMFLLSQGFSPISSILEGVHLIGDHGALVLYPVSLLYTIEPNVHWLFALQAFSLAVGTIPIYALSLQSGLGVNWARTLAVCYVLSPGLFNINFYTEFRTETIAIPALLWIIWAFKSDYPKEIARKRGVSRRRRYRQGIFAIFLVLSCKEAMSITMVGLGFWLWFKQKQFISGLICIFGSIVWFLVAATYVIPNFRGGFQMAGTWHYGSIGNSLPEIAGKIITQPQLLLTRAILPDRLFYYLLLLLPMIIGLHWRKIGAIIPALPMLALNVLADYSGQRDLIHHYSLVIIPFLYVWLIESLGYMKRFNYRPWLSRRLLIIWASVAFLALGKYSYFWTRYLPLQENAQYVNAAISLIEPDDRVLTTGFIAPHLSQRPMIKLLEGEWDLARMEQYDLDTVLIAMKHLSAATPEANAIATRTLLSNATEFNLVYHQQDVFLFQKK